jgi:hypothetical protein
MKKNDRLFNKAVEKLKQAGSKASVALNEVSEACTSLKDVSLNMDGLQATSINIDEMHAAPIMPLTGSLTGTINISKEQIEAAVEKTLDEWIWVEGYKATKKDMTCNKYQYMMGVRHDMPEGAEIKECESGFHFCRDLKDVFGYYGIEKGHRFFKVRALVRKKDYEEYGKPVNDPTTGPFGVYFGYVPTIKNKLTSKSIEFLSELTVDEILTAFGVDITEWTDEDKSMAMEKGTKEVYKVRKVRELMELGYSDLMSKHIVYSLDKYEMAKVLMSQTDISMDTRIMLLFDNDANSDTKIWWDNKSFDLPSHYATVRPMTGSITGSGTSGTVTIELSKA